MYVQILERNCIGNEYPVRKNSIYKRSRLNFLTVCFMLASHPRNVNRLTVTTVNSVSIPRFYSIRSTTLGTLFKYNSVQEILTNNQVSLSVTLKIAAISVMIP